MSILGEILHLGRAPRVHQTHGLGLHSTPGARHKLSKQTSRPLLRWLGSGGEMAGEPDARVGSAIPPGHLGSAAIRVKQLPVSGARRLTPRQDNGRCKGARQSRLRECAKTKADAVRGCKAAASMFTLRIGEVWGWGVGGQVGMIGWGRCTEEMAHVSVCDTARGRIKLYSAFRGCLGVRGSDGRELTEELAHDSVPSSKYSKKSWRAKNMTWRARVGQRSTTLVDP